MSEGFLTNVVFVTGKTNDVATAKSVQARTATEWTTRSSWDNTQWGKSWWLRKRRKTSSRSQSSWKAGVSFHYQFDSNSILFYNETVTEIQDDTYIWHFSSLFIVVFKLLKEYQQCTNCLKITQNVSFEFFNLGIFHQFLFY